MPKKSASSVVHFPEDAQNRFLDIDYISTGSLAIDFAIGRKGVPCGIPRGLVTTVWGVEGGGKSTFVANCVREAQKIGEVAIFDTESRIDPFYYENIGVDMSKITLAQLDFANGIYGEQLGDALIDLAKSGRYALIVMDSVAAWVPKNIAEGEISEHSPGLHARMISTTLMGLINHLKRTNTAMLFTTQRRSKFGGRSFAGPAYEISGGNALKFYSSLFGRIDYLGKITPSSTSKEVIGIRSRITFIKNCGPAYTWAEFEITDALGIDQAWEVIELGKPYKIAYNNGAWFYYTNENGEEIKIGQGRVNAVEFLRNNPTIFQALRKRVLAEMLGKEVQQVSTDAPEGMEAD